jgi:hypothetical protein
MALVGISCVGEFHHLHHAPGGTPYADPNAMSRADRRASAGLRITLLDTCYLSGGSISLRPIPLTAAASVRRRHRGGVGEAGRSPGRDEHGTLGPGAGSGRRSTRYARFRPSRWPRWWREPSGARHCTFTCPEQVAENNACLAAYRARPQPCCTRREFWVPAQACPRDAP